MIKHLNMQVIVVRRIMQAISFVMPAFCYVLIVLSSDNYFKTVFICLSFAFYGAHYAGKTKIIEQTNSYHQTKPIILPKKKGLSPLYVELAGSTHASNILALSNTFASVSGLSCNAFVGTILHKTHGDWTVVFYSLAAINIIGAAIFSFAKKDVQLGHSKKDTDL